MDKKIVNDFIDKLQNKEFRERIITKSKLMQISEDDFYRYTLRKNGKSTSIYLKLGSMSAEASKIIYSQKRYNHKYFLFFDK